MKLLCLFLVLGFIGLTACQKKSTPGLFWGTASVNFNGSPVLPNIRADQNEPHHQGIDLHLLFEKTPPGRSGNLFIYKVPFAEGHYALTDTEVRDIDSLSGASFTTLIGGDVVDDFYDLLESEVENEVVIEKIEDRELWGTFKATFVKDTTYGEGSTISPDTIILDSGRFHTRLFE